MAPFQREAAPSPAWGGKHARRWFALLLLVGWADAGFGEVTDVGTGSRAAGPDHATQAAAIGAGTADKGGAGASAGAPPAAARGLRRVLILQSFGSDFAPYNAVASNFRSRLAERWQEPLEFYEVSLEIARFGNEAEEEPFVAYLMALFAERKVDLVVTLGGAAVRFTSRYRARLFPGVPVLHLASDLRLLPDSSLGPEDTTVSVRNDFAGQVAQILELLPDTEHLAIVIGTSPLERFWRAELTRELGPFEGRLQLAWLDGLSLAETRARVASLPPHSAVLFILYLVDGAGVPHQLDSALRDLSAASNAPVFGLFDTQLGHGIVGGRLALLAEVVDRGVEAAARLLRGEPPAAVRYPPILPGGPVFDFRQLERWKIPASRLPPGSEIRFQAPSAWDLFRWPLLGGLGLFALQSALIAGLLLQRHYRRSAEEEVRSLHGRLLTTFEQERRRLARELHDDLTQRLARLAIDAAQVERQYPALDGNPTLGLMREELVQLSDDVHTLSRRLHPSILDDLGLADALRSEVERFARSERTEVDMRLAETPAGLSPDQALCLFRVAQEALRNVARHAHARRVEVVLRATGAGLELGVRDDGVGFDPGASRRGPGLGHLSLRERLHLVGGQLEISSLPGKGTIVLARVPLAGAVA